MSLGASNFSLALRNTVRHRTRSAIALIAISFSVIALLLAGGFIEWIFWAISVATIETGLGHVQVVRPGYMDSGTADPFSYLLPESSPELSALEHAPHVKVVAPRLNFSGLVSHNETTLSFVGQGVDPTKEAIVSGHLQIPKGKGLSAQDPEGVIVGEGLAANLGVVPGDKIVLLATSASKGINAVECHVQGIFSTRFKAYDDTAIHVPINVARRLLRASGTHIWVVSLDDTENTVTTLARFQSQFKSETLQFVPWFELADFYRKTVTLLSSQMVVVRVIIGVIIVLSISNMLIMNVLERTGEIGTLMAMGARRKQILSLFLSEGLLLGLIGATSGLLVGFVLGQIISAVGIPMPPPPGRSAGYSGEILITWKLAAGAFVLAVGTTALASVYPAWKGSRLIIVDALRHNR
jgi:putative ABC transport system permease protein